MTTMEITQQKFEEIVMELHGVMAKHFPNNAVAGLTVCACALGTMLEYYKLDKVEFASIIATWKNYEQGPVQ